MEIQSLYSSLVYSYHSMLMLLGITFAAINSYIYIRDKDTKFRIICILGNIALALIETKGVISPIKGTVNHAKFKLMLTPIILFATICGNLFLLDECKRINEKDKLKYATA